MRTTVVGNYPKVGGKRAPSLRTALARFDEGTITAEDLRRVEDEVTREVIQEQVEAGVDLITDGQVRWEDGQTYIARRLTGFSLNGLIRYFDTNTYFRQPVAEGRVEWQGPILLRDYRFAREHSPRPVKPVLTGPYTLARLSQDQFYGDLRTFVLDLAEALNRELRELAGESPPLIQVDEPAILKYPDDFPLFQEAMERLTAGVSVPLALYTFFRDVRPLAPEFFRLPFQAFGLDFVMGRGNYEAVRGFPEGKHLAAGIVDARNTRLESPEEVVEAVRPLLEVVPLERLYLQPSCGLEFLPRDRAYQKLVRLVEGARRVKEVLG